MSENLSVTLKEERRFEPSRKFVRESNLQPLHYEMAMRFAKSDPQGYWGEAALDLVWMKPFKQILSWNPPEAKWFLGGTLNASSNCLDRHLHAFGNKTAILWEGEPGEVACWTYSMLHAQVEKLTVILRRAGLNPGDRVAIYMPMVPEAVVAMLACARGGFTHTVVFGGFSAEALKDRIQDAEAKLVITADFGYRKGAPVQLKEQVDLAIKDCPSVKHQIVLKRAQAGRIFDSGVDHAEPADRPALGPKAAAKGQKPATQAAHDGSPAPRPRFRITSEMDWHQAIESITHADQKKEGFAEELDSEHPLFILYTSGTTGKPKGIVHTTGGYLTGVLRTSKTVFDLKPEDLYWCTADIGWVTGHSYVVYGPLAAGASVFMYEGAPTHPRADRFWEMIERHRVSILYTAPTAIRAFMKLGPELPKAHDMSTLRLLGSVGEPINPEAWMWYRENIGGNRCPVVDTYWQTETGAIVISPLPAATATKPGSATLPLPGYDVDVVDKQGNPVPAGQGGLLVIKKPWPSMARTIHGDPERFKKQYFSEFPGGIYFTGDGARKDEDGYIWCMGRVDDVLNVSGHRLGTMEIESALVSHPKVAEAAVVGRPDELKGQGIVAFVTLKASAFNDDAKAPPKSPGKVSGGAAAKASSGSGQKASPELLTQMKNELKAHVVKEIGAIARPDDIRFTEGLPKTRSGKIMRRLLRELATSGQVKGDTTTLEDLNVIAALQQGEEE